MICDICEQIKVKNKDMFNCDSCSKLVCKECGTLTASEIKVLQLTNRIMKFHCPKCLNGDTMSLYNQLLKTKEAAIEDKNIIISLLKQEIMELNEKLNNQKQNLGRCDYSNAVKKQKEEVIIVKPVDVNQNSVKTKLSIEEKVNPSDLGLGVTRVQFIRDGGVAIKYSKNERENAEDVCSNIKESLGQSYEVKIPEKKNPRIILFNVQQRDLEDEENFIERMVLQNTITTQISEREIKIVHNFKNRKGMINVILQMDTKSYECIEQKEMLHIGWRRYIFRDSLNVKQCFNCWKFGHLARNCKKETPTCQKCAGEHKEKDCQSNQVCCANCKYAVDVLKITNIKWDHKAYDKNCEAYKKIVEQLQQRINYPETYRNNKQKI